MALQVENQAHYDAVLAFADRIGLREQLGEKLSYLDGYAEHGERGTTRCRLSKDFAPHSFEFVMERRRPDGEYRRWFVGGLVLHGAHDNGGAGGLPTLSVCLTPTMGWAVHT